MAAHTTKRLRASGGPNEQLLLLLNDHRVMTTEQLSRATGTPARTVLYRLEQLRTAHLVDYDRPGRQTGSAPHHWWLRPAGARLITGTAVADGRRPSAMFSAHAATITEVWLALREHGPTVGLTMTGWATDRGGWQEWEGPTSAWGSSTTKRLTPDAVYEAVLADGQGTAAFIEVDLASMTQTQLKAKLDRYRAYTRDQAWHGRFPHCPPLLLFTTTGHRAVTFTRNAAKLLQEEKPSRYVRRLVSDFDLISEHGRLTVTANGLVRDPAHAVTEPVWNLTDPDAAETTLTEILTERANVTTAAQPAYARERAEALATERQHTLQRLRRYRTQLETLLGPTAVDLIGYLLHDHHDRRDPFTPDLDTSAVLANLADWYSRHTSDTRATQAQRVTLNRLHQAAWSHQVHQLARLAATGDDRPAWYTAAAHLAQPRLLTPDEHRRLDQPRTREQAQADIWRDWTPPGHRDYTSRLTYEQWRDEQVSHQWQSTSWWQRQRTSRDELAAEFDNEHLTACARCGLTLPTNDTGTCPGCRHTERIPHDQRHTITPLADLIAALTRKAG
ncbi:replication-relaxation family protein [Micromonospora sp. NPDC050417]|uniref:replication-relaxation family protein n=1 Tax=Micromonospora sp. NPDC050417 TaxID=3364280 RepID=UPI0037905D0B